MREQTGHLATYEEARSAFVEVARSAGARLESHLHPFVHDANGQPLAVDVARFGCAAPRRLLTIMSGTHGVEGFAGSELQRYYIAELLPDVLAEDEAVVLIHAINPYGFSRLRRANEDNVDVNRNSLDFADALPENQAYARLHSDLLPARWDDTARREADKAIADFIEREGSAQFQFAISAGQYDFPDGLLYGGTQKCWSITTLERILGQHFAGAARIAVIDIHTGLGAPGIGELMILADDRNSYAELADRVGQVTFIGQADAISPPVDAHIGLTLRRMSNAPMLAMALEYGTVPFNEVFEALRAETWHHINDPGSLADLASKQALKSAFYVDSNAWREALRIRLSDIITHLPDK